MKPLLIVDGYNVIGAWKDAERNQWSLDECRDRLIRQLQNHAGYTGEEVVLVFDGYQSDRRMATVDQQAGIRIVYTRHGETADSYIERLAAETPKYRVLRVATSDGLEQSQVFSTGATRISSRELLLELRETRRTGIEPHKVQDAVQKRSIAGRLDEKTLAILEKMRRE